VHLKRFEQNSRGRSSKISTHVRFDRTLSMAVAAPLPPPVEGKSKVNPLSLSPFSLTLAYLSFEIRGCCVAVITARVWQSLGWVSRWRSPRSHGSRSLTDWLCTYRPFLGLDCHSVRMRQGNKKSKAVAPPTPAPTMVTYDLTSVCSHLGTMHGGHYVAYVRRGDEPEESQWFYASDRTVKQVPFEDVARCAAYILFYTRREPCGAINA
jgi:hypothetical protein